MTNHLWYTPRSLAEERGIDADVILRWIRNGALEAIDVSEAGRKPRWRISAAAVAEFDRRRSSRTRVAPARPQRRRQEAGVPKWF